MTKSYLIIFLLLCFVSCAYSNETGGNDEVQATIDGITFENYPRIDGSTSTKPLNALIACKLLGVRYEWRANIVGEWSVQPNPEDIPALYSDFYNERIQVSQTHGAFVNLIDGNADIILTHRTISPDEKAHADDLGVTLIETSIALDGFIFVVNKTNPVKSLTVEQVQRIYTGEITNWKQVGGNDQAIQPYTRPRNSGSEEIMRSLVMNDLEIADFPENSEIVTMAGVFPEVRNNASGFCYTFNFYKDLMVRLPDTDVPKIAINGIFPNENTIKEHTYPFVAEVHVAIRSDLDKNSMAYKMYEWLQTANSHSIISESGYIPKNSASHLSTVAIPSITIYPNPVSDGFYVSGLPYPTRFILIDSSGSQAFSRQVSDKEYVDIHHLPQGTYILQWAADKGWIQNKIVKQ